MEMGPKKRGVGWGTGAKMESQASLTVTEDSF